MNLEEYIKALQSIIEDYPEMAKLPVAYASDDEGNSYHKVTNTGTPCNVEDISAYYLEGVKYFNGIKPDKDNEDNISREEVNCIIIN